MANFVGRKKVKKKKEQSTSTGRLAYGTIPLTNTSI